MALGMRGSLMPVEFQQIQLVLGEGDVP